LTSATEIALLEFTGTCFEQVAPATVERLLEGSRRFYAAAGTSVFPNAEPGTRVAMMLAGTARSFLTAADGRQLTVRYARRGSFVGKYSDLSGDHAPLALHAITDCTIIEFDLATFTSLATTDVSLTTAIVADLAQRLDDIYATIGDSAFGSVRQRIVRHLLALEHVEDGTDVHFASITHQQLADAIGSSREVVARQMSQLRLDGLIRTRPGQIELLNIGSLVALLGHWRAESPY
jgi:CRP/FNR family transcriptional regulator, cyclic AMP receptor protein